LLSPRELWLWNADGPFDLFEFSSIFLLISMRYRDLLYSSSSYLSKSVISFSTSGSYPVSVLKVS
jgi:hypothetical protein